MYGVWGDGVHVPANRAAGVTRIIEINGGIVAAVEHVPDSFAGLCGLLNDQVPLTVVGRQMSRAQRRLLLARELGHLVMDLRSADEATRQRRTQRFAAALLAPRAMALRELGRQRRRLHTLELTFLSNGYGLPVPLWIDRAYDLGIITKAHRRTLRNELAARQKQQPPRPPQGEQPAEESPQRLLQLTARAMAERLEVRKHARQLLDDHDTQTHADHVC